MYNNNSEKIYNTSLNLINELNKHLNTVVRITLKNESSIFNKVIIHFFAQLATYLKAFKVLLHDKFYQGAMLVCRAIAELYGNYYLIFIKETSDFTNLEKAEKYYNHGEIFHTLHLYKIEKLNINKTNEELSRFRSDEFKKPKAIDNLSERSYHKDWFFDIKDSIASANNAKKTNKNNQEPINYQEGSPKKSDNNKKDSSSKKTALENYTLTKLVDEACLEIEVYNKLSKLAHCNWFSQKLFFTLDNRSNTFYRIDYYDGIGDACTLIVIIIEKMQNSFSQETKIEIKFSDLLQLLIIDYFNMIKEM